MDPISINCFFGSSSASSDIFGFEVFDSTAVSASSYAAYQSDGFGNIYGSSGYNIIRVSNGSLVWQRTYPSEFSLSQSGIVRNVAVSPNGTYVVFVGGSGSPVYSNFPSEANITRIDTSNGQPIKVYKSSSSLTNRVASLEDVVVDNNGICNAVGNHYRLLDAPYNEFLRFAVNLSTETMLVNEGSTSGTYSETFSNVDQNLNYAIMGGTDIQRPQAGYQQYNWTLLNKTDNTRVFSNSYQSNGGNGVYGNGVTIDSSNNIFAGYGNLSSQRGIMKMNTSGTITARKSIYVSSATDTAFSYLSNDNSNIYFLGYYLNPVTSKYFTIVGCLDSSMNFVWANKISNDSYTIWPKKIRYNPETGKLDVSVYKSDINGYSAYFALPSDGSGTGTYGDYTYSSQSLTVTNDGITSWYSASPPTFGNWGTTIGTDTNSQSTNLSANIFL